MNIKRSLLFIAAFISLSLQIFASVPSSNPSLPLPPTARQPLGSAKDQVRIAQMKAFVKLSPSDYEKLSGKRLSVMEKATFTLSQKRMKKRLQRYDYGDVTTLEKIAWFGKGLILGPIAVLLAYLFTTEENRELVKWAWFGFAGWAIILAIILVAVL
jgi:hypothetical protein